MRLVLSILVALLVALAITLRLIVPQSKPNAVVFLGSGGHTGEMLRMLERVDLRGIKLILVYSKGDELSLERSATLGATAAYAVPRARHVGQPIFEATWDAFKSLVACYKVILTVSPRLLLCNGPGTCVMLVIASRTLTLLGLASTKIVYVESFARVDTLSLTGKILYRLVDKFIVQWEPLSKKFPKTEYIGLLV